jgi:hypothetical protein
MNRSTFLLAFVLGPTLAFGIIPCVIFGFLIGEVGTNIIWGPVFGSGFWLADLAFWVPGHSHAIILILALLWAFVLIPLILFLASDWLWRKCRQRGRHIALTILLVTLLFDVPARWLDIMALHGFVLPDWALYISANS